VVAHDDTGVPDNPATCGSTMSGLTRLLKESWALVEDRQDRVANAMYARAFIARPDLRRLFPLPLGVRHSAMLHTIVDAAIAADDEERMAARLGGLGRDHRRFGVTPEHFDTIGAALVEALRSVAGHAWLPEYEHAWLAAYAALVRHRVAAAAADTGPASVAAEVVRHERRGRDVAVLTCRPEQPLSWRAGQYVYLESQVHPRLWRPYSVANAPDGSHTLEFHVRALSDGLVSGALVRRLAVGDWIRLGTPSGSMTLDRGSNRDIVCVAGGTGLAPLKALVEELTTFNRTRWVHVFLGARDRDDLYDLPAMQGLAARYPWLSVVPACSEDPWFPGEQGLVNDVLARFGPWEQHDFFVCGPPAMVRATTRTLAELAVPSVRVNADPLPVEPTRHLLAGSLG
jgi:NAD(P)H-flavin reductase/hemoglobin-like flavoprotein